MPTYEYTCSKCGHEFETIQAITAKPLKVCPQSLCHRKRWGRGKVKRKIGIGGGIIFKGSGFYVTDYRSESYKAAAKKDVPSPASTAGDSKSSGDAKSATENKSKPAKAESKPAKSSNASE